MNNISNSKLSAVEEEVIPFEDDYEEQYKLYRSVVRSEGRNVNDGCKRSYLPMFKHPLPVSEHRMEHENILRYSKQSISLYRQTKRHL